MNSPDTLQGMYRIPLDAQRAGMLHRLLLEHPNHWLIIREPFLEVHA